MTLSVGFPPIVGDDARVLILGTLPGVASLARGQYYGHPANAFWWIMGELFGAEPALPYPERCERLRAGGIALWDVCAAARRAGSLDSAIEPATIAANDIAGLLGQHPGIGLIAFNGGPAARLFRRHVLPGLPPATAALPRVVLPSTSPAYAAMPRAEKLARWRAALGAFADRG